MQLKQLKENLMDQLKAIAAYIAINAALVAIVLAQIFPEAL